VLAVLTVLLGLSASVWSDQMTLARYNVVNHPASPRANFYFANALFKRLDQADALVLPEQERRELAVQSRYHFNRMHELDGREFAALVMLYQIDTLYFPRLAEENDWLAKLQVLAGTRRLRPSDVTALGALVEFSAKSTDQPGTSRVVHLLDEISKRYPRRSDLAMLRYRYLAGQKNANAQELRTLLEQEVAANPASTEVYAYLVQYHGKENIANTYETIGAWMQQDKNRMDLPVIRRIFAN